MIQHYLTGYFTTLRWLLVAMTTSLVVMMVVRLCGLLLADITWQEIQIVDLANMLVMGIRFDSAVFLRICLIFVLASAIAILLPSFLRSWTFFISRTVGVLAAFVLVSLSIANLAYLSFFNVPFNEFAIEGMLFDWKMVAASTIEAGNSAYFIVLGGLASFYISYFVIKLNKNYTQQNHILTSNPLLGFVVVLVSIALVLVIARGSVSTYPLIRKHAAVTSSQELNKLVENGPFALFEAYRGFKNSEKFSPADEQQGRSLYEQFYGYEPAAGPVYEQFFTSTPNNPLLAAKPPHVVLGIGESFSSTLLSVKNTGSVQMGAMLERHLQEDIYFERFLPAHIDTQSSMINLLTNLDYAAVSQSKYRTVSLDTAAAKVYQSKGYKTVYIYAGYETERNVQQYYLQQGFDEFIGAYGLQHRYPHMPLNVQGGEDYYAFALAKKFLAESTQPMFIVVQTINNHPPYEVPEIPGMDKDLRITEQMLHINGSLPKDALWTYYNTVRVMGDFANHVKSTDLKDTTIFAFSGDHGARGILTERKTYLSQKAVPFYVYVPDQLRQYSDVDEQQIASHRDIMPTLYNFSLSGARYLNLGRNLLVNEVGHNGRFAIGYQHIITGNGLVDDTNSTTKHFTDKDSLLLGDKTSPANEQVIQKATAYMAILDWLKRYQLVNMAK